MLHLILGQQGSGKTLLMTAIAYKAYQEGKTIYSNVAFKFPYQELNYQDIIDCNLKNAACIIDEIHQLLPARNSMSRVNREIADSFISMIRKQNLEVYGSTQTPRKVDIRFKDETDYIYQCQKYAYQNGKWNQSAHNQNLSNNVPVMIYAEVSEVASGRQVVLKLHANSFYSMYDTNQIINVKGIKLKDKDRRTK